MSAHRLGFNAKIAGVAGSKLTGSITTATIPGANVTGAVANATNATNAMSAASLATPGGVYAYLINGATPGPYPSLGFNTYGNFPYLAGVAGYGGIFQFQDGDGKFGFYSSNSSVAAGAEHTFTPRLVILNNGNVGIGTVNSVVPGEIFRLSVGSGDFGGDLASGVLGVASGDGAGVFGQSNTGFGVSGFSYSGVGVRGTSLGNLPGTSYAGYFSGKMFVSEAIEKPGGGFKIDHPLDPENKYLVHSFVESPDMKNLYDGTVTTDANGEAEITLPDWFAALNRDFRYQLTCIGVFAQAIVAEEIKDNRFRIRTSLPQVKVS